MRDFSLPLLTRLAYVQETAALNLCMLGYGYAPGAVGYPNSRGLYLRRLDLSGPTPVVEPAS